MANVVHPILGALDPSGPGYWEGSITLGGRAVTVDLTIDGVDLTAADVNELPQRPEDLLPLDRAARLAILQDALSGDDDSAATLYLTHHHGELPSLDFRRLFGADSPDLADPEAMLSRMVLVRVGLYPEIEDAQVLLDYSIDPDATDYLLCVSFDADREPVAVDLES